MKSRKRRDDGWDEGRPDDDPRDNRAADGWQENWPAGNGYQQGAAAGYPGGGPANGPGYPDRDQYGNQPRGRAPQGYDPRGYEPPGAPGYPEPRHPGGRTAAAGYARPRFPEADGYDFGGQDPQGYQGGRVADPAYGDQRQADRQGSGQYGRPVSAPPREFLQPDEPPAGNENGAVNTRPYGRLTIFTLLDDKAAEFDHLAERAAEGVRMAEPDTLVYVIHVVPKAPMQRIIYEIYRDRAAFEDHERQPHMQRFAADRKSCVLATNVIDLRLKYAKVAALGAPEVPPVPPAPPAAPVPPVPAAPVPAAPVPGRETQVDWTPRPAQAGQYPGDRYPAGNGQYQQAPGNGQYTGNGQYSNGQYSNGQYSNSQYSNSQYSNGQQYGNGQYGNGQHYGGGQYPGQADGRQQDGSWFSAPPANGRQPDSGRPAENGGGYPDRNGSRSGRHGGS
jgi:quinol monooxygenase YgiN